MLTVVFECNALMQKCNFEKKNKIAEKDNDDDESSAVNNPMHETENNLFLTLFQSVSIIAAIFLRFMLFAFSVLFLSCLLL